MSKNIKNDKIRIAIVGCGAIGSRIAVSLKEELSQNFILTALFDTDNTKSNALATELSQPGAIKNSLDDAIDGCDLMVEAVNAEDTELIIKKAIESNKHVLAMSVGKLLSAEELFKLAETNHCQILLPSGAIAGIDAIKAAALRGINSLTLTTSKPPSGLGQNPYFTTKGIDVSKIHQKTIVFEGDVATAVKCFPQNINVAATIALASKKFKNFKIRIVVDPDLSKNSHEVEMTGEFGKMISRTENVPCPDNPKTSYLAVLSGIEALKQFSESLKIGT